MSQLRESDVTRAADPAATLRLGWIGVGRMGAAMARRLLRAGCEVALYNRTRAKADELASEGAVIVERPADLADRDLVFTMVASSADLIAVTCGDGGLLTASASPSLVVDSSTVSATASEIVRARAEAIGTALLAAPVSGNPKVVAAGKATIAASGPSDAFDVARPYLEMICRSATYVGARDNARLVKIAHNLVLGIVAEALAETAVLVEKAGVPRRAYLEFLNDSVLGSTFSRYKTPSIVGLDWTPTFTPELLCKDLDLGLEAGAALGVSMPLVDTARIAVQELIDAGLTDHDFQALLLLRAQAAELALMPDTDPVSDGLDPATPAHEIADSCR